MGVPIVPYFPPKSRSGAEQSDLAERIVVARGAGMTWDEIAAMEGVPKRTLQHFSRGWQRGSPAADRARRRGERAPPAAQQWDALADRLSRRYRDLWRAAER
jgi:transposase